ncbi:MAG: nucleotide pyrophosphohydrolase [Parcubacteria group bacterium]|nr:nucleotide pyrophosphohydrolase [Parcubacteria group bacterium]
MSIKDRQNELDKWFTDKKWPYWKPHEIMVRLMEEVGELARLVNHEFGPKKKKETEAPQDFEDEIGDVLYTLICFANSNNIDLDKAIKRSFDKVMERDKDRFPADK